MKPLKIYFLFFVLPLLSVSGQSFVKTIPKPTVEQGIIFSDTTMPAVTQDLLRPIIEVSSIGFPGAILLTGGGFSYQHLKFIKDRWKVIWSISYMTWYDTKKVFQGLTFGVLNNLILLGVAVHSKEVIGTVGIGFNLNN